MHGHPHEDSGLAVAGREVVGLGRIPGDLDFPARHSLAARSVPEFTTDPLVAGRSRTDPSHSSGVCPHDTQPRRLVWHEMLVDVRLSLPSGFGLTALIFAP